MLNGDYQYHEPRGIITGSIDSKGVVHISEGQHRVNAALEILEETGDATYLNKLISHSQKGIDGRTYMSNGEPNWDVRKLPRRKKESWWKFW
ncbi:hypothetical protein [Zooshikella ganghwensis]|uniref:Uncharacterized protein n=1 Tax=Zooshikella ganghwensis TaxID=202772 RepID=A0A4P9VIB7_9GAMM|nr:hypothetical protein [Zooshikella ganghwensis]RDH42199.1 hypothetical protein B9G39_01360 [Zooshikella ganghwensis]